MTRSPRLRGRIPASAGPLLRPPAGDFSSIPNHSAYALIERDKTRRLAA
ncbi:MAG: hypothetical protein WHV61_00080 [Burkholderiales bacterium]